MNFEEEYQRMAYSEEENYASDADDSLYTAAQRFLKKVGDGSEKTRAESSLQGATLEEFEKQCENKATSLISDNNEHNSQEDPALNQKNELAACCFALLSGVCHALSLAVNTALGAEVGKNAVFLQVFGAAFAFLSYHQVRLFKWLCNGRQGLYWEQYYDENKGESLLVDTQRGINFKRILIPITNAIVMGCGLCGVFGAFYFLGLCKQPVNSGVISSIFSTSLVFVSVIFYCLFGQKLSLKGILGIGLILQSVAILSMSAGSSQGGEKMTKGEISRDAYLTRMSILFALFAAFSFALHCLFYKLVVIKFNNTSLVQLTYDTAAVFGLMLLAPLSIKVYSGELIIEPYTVMLSMLSFNLTNLGVLLSAQSIKFGKAGVVQGIENLKTVWLTVIMSLVQGRAPNIMQISGILLGLAGAVTVIQDRAK